MQNFHLPSSALPCRSHGEGGSESGFFNARILCAFVLCSVGAFMAMLSFAATPPVATRRANTRRGRASITPRGDSARALAGY